MSDFTDISLNEQLTLAQTSTDPEILARLAVHHLEVIRNAVAFNPNTPPEVLDHLLRTTINGYVLQ